MTRGKTVTQIPDVGAPFNIHPSAPETEYSKQFLQGMVNRMCVSFYKYGKVADAYPDKMDAIANVQKRLAQYLETGNTEWLIDAANFLMIEFMHPALENASFRATDSDEAPGRVKNDGSVVNETRNEEL